VQAARVRPGHHVEVVADQVLSHARGLAAAGDAHAEPGQDQQPGERPHAFQVAPGDRRRAAEQQRLILNLE
jgi:hypothetical protein